MSPPILVTGGTGTLGVLVVRRLQAAGHGVRVLTRQARSDDRVEFVTGNLVAGTGIGAAVDGVDTIIHCASGSRGDAVATRNLVDATRATGRSPHLVYISIVGIARVRFSYYRSKLASEAVVTESGLPWTILRATQFYDLILRAARVLARLPVVPVPRGFAVQPVDADEVAARLVELALAGPAGRVPDLGGPEVLSFAAVLRTYLDVRGDHRRVVSVPVPGLGAVRAGALLTAGPSPDPAGRRTWRDFLTSSLA